MNQSLEKKYQQLELSKHFEAHGWSDMTLHVDGENYIFTVTGTAYDVDDRPYGQESLTVLDRAELEDLYQTLKDILYPDTQSINTF